MSGQKATSGKGRNDSRPNGKAWKKRKRTGEEGANGKTVAGYTHAKHEIRFAKRNGGAK